MCRNRCCRLHVVSSIVCILSPCGFAVSSLSVPLLSTEHKLSASQETVYPRRTAHSGLCTVHPAAPALGSLSLALLRRVYTFSIGASRCIAVSLQGCHRGSWTQR
uniref:Secreted protein n=1 Tax=Rhipicephalus zambeziensis TaxID=60191 RepID=A0A224YG41_9ACAR